MKQSIYPVSLDKCLLQSTLNKSSDRYKDEYNEKMVPLVVGRLQKVQIHLVLNLWKSPAGMEHHFSDRYFLIYSLMVTVPLFVSYLCEHHGHQMFPVDHLSLPSYLLISFPQIYCR